MADSWNLLHLAKWSLVWWKIADIPKSVFDSIFSLMDVLKMVIMGFSVIWGGCEIYTSHCGAMKFCMLKIFKGLMTFNGLLLWKTKNLNMAGSWKLKFILYCLETTHEPLHLDKWSFVQWKIMNIPMGCTWILIFFGGSFEYGSGSEFWGYVGTNAKLLSVEFCNFVGLNYWTSE
jgi:hypothetical protein